MDPLTIKLTLDAETALHLQSQKPRSLPLATFCALLIEQSLGQALDKTPVSPLQPPVRGADKSSSASALDKDLEEQPLKDARARPAKDPYAAKVVSDSLIPSDLLDCQQELLEFWKKKKGSRSESTWSRVCNRLRGWDVDVRRIALENAINAGWGDVYEPRGIPAKAAKTVNWEEVDHVSFFK
jgi:hypothetical protein